MKTLLRTAALVALIGLTAACSKSNDPEQDQSANTEYELYMRPRSISMSVDDVQRISARLINANGEEEEDADILWSSSHSDVAEIDQSGLLVAMSAGQTTITATCYKDKKEYSAKCNVEVKDAIIPDEKPAIPVGQEGSQTDNYNYPEDDPLEEHQVFSVIEQSSRWPQDIYGCTFNEWVLSRMEYPAIAQAQGIQGAVIIEVIVHKNGRLSDFNVLRTADQSLSSEALRLIRRMPDWYPGKQNGQSVCSKYILRFNFTLQ